MLLPVSFNKFLSFSVIDGKAMEVLECKLGRSLGPFIRQLYRQMGQADAATRLLDEGESPEKVSTWLYGAP